MTWVQERSSTRSPHGNRVLLRASVMLVSVFACRSADDAIVTGRILRVGRSIRIGCCRAGATTIIVSPTLGLTGRLAEHDVVDLLDIDGFVLHQRFGHQIQLVTILFQQALGGGIAAIDDAAYFFIDQPCGFTGNVGVLATGTAAQEHFALFLGIHQRTELLGHAPLGHHVPRQLGGAHDVIGGASGHTIETQGHFLGDTTTKQRADLTGQGALGKTVTILLRQEHGHAQSATAGDDRYLVDRIVLGHQTTNDGVAGFVVGSVELFLVGHDHGFALGAHHDLVLGHLEFVHLDQALAGAGGEQGRLVHQVGQVGAGEAGRTTGDGRRHHIITQRDLAHVYLEDLLATTDIRQANDHLTVEAARAQQRRVEHVRTVGRGNHVNTVVGFEAVHLHQQLVQGLLALVMTAAQACATMTAHRIDLVDEDDAGRMLLGLLEHVAHPAGADTDEHFYKIGAGDSEERHLGLAGNRLGQQCLTGTGLTDHQYAARDMPTQTLELARVAQEFNQFADFFLGLVATGDISKGGLDLIFGQHARLALAEAHRPAAATATALHLTHEEHEDGNDDQDREAGNQQLSPDALALRLLAFIHHIIFQQVADQAVVLDRRAYGLEYFTIPALTGNHEAIHG